MNIKSKKKKNFKKYKIRKLHAGKIMLNATKFKPALLYYDIIICKYFL